MFPTIHGIASQGSGAASWWEAGGATGAIVAYQSIGAASLAASYLNRVNPGTYDAAPGVAPTWDAVNGWEFDTTKWLDTGVSPQSGWSYAILFSYMSIGTSTRYAFGSVTGAGLDVGIVPYRSVDRVDYRNGNGRAEVSPSALSGVLAMAGQNGYRDGVLDTSSIPAPTGTNAASIHINGYNNGSSHSDGSAQIYIKAFAIYNNTLTAPQVLAISTALLAL